MFQIWAKNKKKSHWTPIYMGANIWFQFGSHDLDMIEFELEILLM